MNSTTKRFETRPAAAILAAALLALAGAAHDASAQTTDLANTPLITTSSTVIKPNVMFVLDDSGSMDRTYMPDHANFASNKYGRYSSHCNGLAFNPDVKVTYPVAVDADGLTVAPGTNNYPAAFTYPAPSSLSDIRTVISAAPTVTTGAITVTLDSLRSGDYAVGDQVTLYSNSDQTRWMVGTVTALNTTANTLDVDVQVINGSGTLTDPRAGRGDFRPFYYAYDTTATGATTALGYTYAGDGTLSTSTPFYQQCNSVIGQTPGSGYFKKVALAPGDINDKYRNWHVYYRTRMLAMRTATSRAFRDIGDSYRVGFSTISATTVDGSYFLDVNDFNAAQKTTWYSRLFTADRGGWTPLRGALSKAGRYFAGKGLLAGGGAQTYDPVQYSCQKNFTILTTDGYWNIGSGTDHGTETATYGPLKLDGTFVGQQDAAAARPMRDGSTTVIEERTSLLEESNVQWQSRTLQLQSTTRALWTRTRSSGGSSWSGWTQVASCVPANNYPKRECSYSNSWSSWSNAASCSVQNDGWNGSAYVEGRACRYTNPVWVSSSSCTPYAQPANTYGAATVTECRVDPVLSWSNASSCTVSSTKQCRYTAWTNWTTVSACSDVAQSAGPNYTVVNARECRPSSTGGSSDSLADVAMYYYETDLRTSALGNCTANGRDVCENNVRVRGVDNATHQHMTTFTIGMGVNGMLGYDPNYLSGQSADFEAIKGNTKNWPNHDATDLGKSEPERIDDLWHAAVNGRGQYFSAGDPDTLEKGLSDALLAIEARSGTASAAATSTLQPVPGDNTEFVTSYTTLHWVGDVVGYKVDPVTGVRSSTKEWSAQEELDKRTTSRNIYYMKRNAGNNTGTLQPFEFTNLNSDGLGAHFENVCSKTPALSQCTDSSYDIAGANQGGNLVTWLRGNNDTRFRARQHKLADMVGGAPVYVGKPPFQYTEHNYQTFVATTNASNSNTGRKGMVYVPSNGGMLHAFQASSGEELWAFVPSMVMDRMYRLADNDYATKHEYYVNATPVIGDVWNGSAWRTILVGGLGAGGRGYYALDVTNPDSPQALWEFSNDLLGGNSNLGLTFGNPVITKRRDATSPDGFRWVVIFTSGYNNVSPGDGNGRLYIVDAMTGQRLDEIATNVSAGVAAGTVAAPSGLAKINNWVESQRDNTTLRVYGGDIKGNVWRFDIDGLVEPKNAALRLAYLRGGSPVAAQPITTRPELGSVDSGGTSYPVVYVATGRMLGVSDLTNTSRQSLYAIKDPLTNTPLGDVLTRSDMVEQTLTVGLSKERTVTNHPVDLATKSGWRVDFPTSGERVNIDMRLALTTLVVGTNAPSTNACADGGSSFLYKFDFTSGSSMPAGGGVVGVWLADTFAVGIGVMQLFDAVLGASDPSLGAGRGGAVVRTQMGDGNVRVEDMYTPPTKPVDGRRTSWRELID